jgi:hypothetical protein
LVSIAGADLNPITSRWNAFPEDCETSGTGPWHKVARTRP